MDPAVVETVTATAVLWVPSSVTRPGLTVQEDSNGAPEQASSTVALNPPSGATVKGYVAVPPTIIFLEGTDAASEKSCPVPVSATVCGLVTELSAIDNVPTTCPEAEGENVTLIVQFELAASDVPQLSVSAKAARLDLMLEIVSAVLPVFVSVTVCAALLVFTICPLKVRLLGETVAVG